MVEDYQDLSTEDLFDAFVSAGLRVLPIQDLAPQFVAGLE